MANRRERGVTNVVEMLASRTKNGSNPDQRSQRYRKMSFGAPDPEDEVRSIAASSCSGSGELNSNISEASCSQSDISLCDDGGSEEEEGEGWAVHYESGFIDNPVFY